VGDGPVYHGASGPGNHARLVGRLRAAVEESHADPLPRADPPAIPPTVDPVMAALSLLSGGLDSTVATALHAARVGPVELGLFIDYGQRAAGPEERAALAVGRALGFEVLVTQIPLLGQLSNAALVDRSAELPHPDPERVDVTATETAAAVWIPNRNGVLVNLAAAVAEARGLDRLIVGFNAEEAASFPDNSARFLANLDACLEDSTMGRVSLSCPTLELGKAAILEAGREVGAPLDLTWSCYDGGEEACGRCESCVRRARAERGATSL